MCRDILWILSAYMQKLYILLQTEGQKKYAHAEVAVWSPIQVLTRLDVAEHELENINIRNNMAIGTYIYSSLDCDTYLLISIL